MMMTCLGVACQCSQMMASCFHVLRTIYGLQSMLVLAFSQLGYSQICQGLLGILLDIWEDYLESDYRRSNHNNAADDLRFCHFSLCQMCKRRPDKISYADSKSQKKIVLLANDCTVLVSVMIGFLWFTCIYLDGLVSHIRWIDSMYIKLDLYIVDMWLGKNVFF